MLIQKLNEETYIEKLKDDSIINIDTLHSRNKGYITFASIENGQYSQWHYKYKDLINFVKCIEYDYDCYISQNTFFTTYRRIECLKEISALYIDLDYYNTGFRKESVLYFLQSELYDFEIPLPTLVLDSGRGLYLIWKIKNVPSQALPLFNAIQRYLYEKLKAFGADKKSLDCTRILRIAGTLNTKSQSIVEILEINNIEYDIHNIQNEYLPELPRINKEKTNICLHKKGRPTKPISLFNEYTLYYSRIQDIVLLCNMRKWDLEGLREEILFLYRYWSCCFIENTEDALKQVLELNSQFKKPLSENEVKRATKSAEKCYLNKDKQYKYKNETLIDLLDITEEEQKHLKSIIGKKEKRFRNNERTKKDNKAKRRNESGLTKRQQAKQNMINIIKEKLELGLGVEAIAKELKISIGRVSEIKNNKY